VFLRDWRSKLSWLSATTIVTVAALTIAPWTIRNWLVFEDLVPIRTGVGLISHQGNPILAATYHPNAQACTDELGPMWSAPGPREAIALIRADRSDEKEQAIYKRSFDCIALRAPEDYFAYSEAERDQFYLRQAQEFIRAEPLVFAELAAYKYLAIITGWTTSHTIVGVLAILGGLLALRNPRGVVIVLLVGAFVGPYAIGSPWGYRYRIPIEPLFVLLASYSFVWFLSRALPRPIARKLRLG
jgi:hypothetical protein